MNDNNIRNGLLYLEERGWSELIDPRWTLDVYEELQLSGLGLSDEEMREVIDVVCHPEPDWNTTEHLSHREEFLPTDKDRVFTSIKYNGFTPHTLQLIDKYITDIQNGTRDLLQFNQPEHAGVCSAGPLLIGSLVVCDFARESISASSDASGSETPPANWQIDEAQEQQLKRWAEAKGVWIPEAEEWLQSKYGPMMAQGAEAKVYGQTGDTHVIKLRTSIYATLGRALEAIALHNYLFPQTIMRVIGFTRDADGLFRIILTQPYVECKRLATKAEIDALVNAKGFSDNGDGNGVNYLSSRLHLEDMHPANVFVEQSSDTPVCIDCIVKFRRDL